MPMNLQVVTKSRVFSVKLSANSPTLISLQSNRLSHQVILLEMHYIASTAHIMKEAEDQFHFVVDDRFRKIDELVDDVKLLGMLKRESLTDSNGEPVSAEEIVDRADSLNVGQEITVTLVQRAG